MLCGMMLSVLLATAPADVTPEPTTAPVKPPHDPPVFRCVLDENPRMLVISFGDDLWMSFDTTTCTVARVWKGDIDFTGTLYDHRHGPQPRSRGETMDVPLLSSLFVRDPATAAMMNPHWIGHTISPDGTTTLRYRFDALGVSSVYELRVWRGSDEQGNPTVLGHERLIEATQPLDVPTTRKVAP